MQDALRRLNEYWTERGCLVVQPFNTEVGAGTMNPATVLRVLGPEPWDVAYVEPSVRPDDSRYGENPNRLQMHTQFQVILKPEPGDPQEQYLGSLEALGIDLAAHDVRFVEDNWQQPAIGAWGLGWEVWLDGLEITQFTYFQQVGGHNLDPIPVELTYGMERILMALQGVDHFKDIVYSIAPDGRPITYGEAFGQSEYEMSRYYLDDADVDTNRRLYEAYVSEATRMVEARLPVPAHIYILKSSHAFNVMDARGAISTTERARAFATMRRLMRDTATLWIERREEMELPLLRETQPKVLVPPAPSTADALGEAPAMLAFEVGVEELPPHVVPQTVEAVRRAVTEKLAATRLDHGEIFVEGTPRRIVVTVADVAAREPDAEQLRKGPRWQAAFDADGNPTKALQGFARGQGVAVEDVFKADFGGNDHAAVTLPVPGRDVLTVAGQIVSEVVSGLRAEKNMRWHDPELSFSRAIRWLVALWGTHVVPVEISRLQSGRATYLQRTTGGAASATRTDGVPLGVKEVASAEELLPTLAEAAILVETDARRAAVIAQASALAGTVGGTIDFEGESALVDEITNLVEEPHAILGGFDPRYLDLPDQILTTVMRKHQRYLPLFDDAGRLMPFFVTVANGLCDDEMVARGNESVVRARFEDALFFWDADLRVGSVDEFVPGLEKLVFEEKLGSVGQRARRIAEGAEALAGQLGVTDAELATLRRAGELAKFDLATQLVVDMSSLAGFAASEYALRKGETQEVAVALAETEFPRTASGEVPASTPGALLAIADRADLLVGMFSVGARPTGSSDPFGLRRAALGLVRILREVPAVGSLTVSDALAAAADRYRAAGVEVSDSVVDEAAEFALNRFAQLMRDEGQSVTRVQAVTPSMDAPGRVAAILADIASAMADAGLKELVQSLVRIERIVPAGTPATVDADRLVLPAEQELVAELAEAEASETLTAFAAGSKGLVAAITRFFDDVLVNDPDADVRAARLGLLQSVRDLAPAGLDYGAIEQEF